MPSDGGQPTQLTFYQGQAQPLSDRMGVLNEVIGWTPDSQNVIFLSRRDASNGWTKRPFTVSVNGGMQKPMVMDEGGRTAIAYGVYGVPETFFVSADGVIVDKQVGPLTPERLSQLIARAKARADGGRS